MASFLPHAAHAPWPAHLPPPPYAMRRVGCREDWENVAALRGRCGLVEGEAADRSINATTILLERHGTAIGTTRTMVSSGKRRAPLTGMDVYRREVEAAIGLDATLVEASRTAIDPAALAQSKSALLHLFKAMMLQCILEDADCLLIAVREPEIGFYRRMLSMEMLSGPEDYPGSSAPLVLMGLDVRAHAGVLGKRIPMVAVTSHDYEAFRETGCLTLGGHRPA